MSQTSPPSFLTKTSAEADDEKPFSLARATVFT